MVCKATNIRQKRVYYVLLAQRRVTVRVFWTAGHASLRGNDLADDLAKMAALEARTLTNSSGIRYHLTATANSSRGNFRKQDSHT